jgi:hypothetical protein
MSDFFLYDVKKNKGDWKDLEEEEIKKDYNFVCDEKVKEIYEKFEKYKIYMNNIDERSRQEKK